MVGVGRCSEEGGWAGETCDGAVCMIPPPSALLARAHADRGLICCVVVADTEPVEKKKDTDAIGCGLV